jgi:3-oxoacyl-[acyl-carrier protein] reductase
MVKRVLVTGANKGIGKSIALKLAQDGFSITVHCRSGVNEANSVIEEINLSGGKANFIQFDVSNRQETSETLENFVKEHGAFYGVVCNAGITADTAFPAMTDNEWDDVIHTNLDSFYNVLKPLVMPMVQTREGGRIVTLASVSGVIGNRGQVNYSASKSGIIGATKALSLELAKRKITVNCVAPGFIDTGMTEELDIKNMKKMIPMQRTGNPGEVAHAVSFLMSDGASYITRQVISVNGGIA